MRHDEEARAMEKSPGRTRFDTNQCAIYGIMTANMQECLHMKTIHESEGEVNV